MDEDLVCGLIVTSVCDFYFVINWKETRRFFKTLYYLDVLFLEILMKSFFIKKKVAHNSNDEHTVGNLRVVPLLTKLGCNW